MKKEILPYHFSPVENMLVFRQKGNSVALLCKRESRPYGSLSHKQEFKPDGVIPVQTPPVSFPRKGESKPDGSFLCKQATKPDVSFPRKQESRVLP